MKVIMHMVAMKAPPRRAYDALATRAGLNYNWGRYLTSLKLSETGTGAPFGPAPAIR
jgi:hypothetical protein